MTDEDTTGGPEEFDPSSRAGDRAEADASRDDRPGKVDDDPDGLGDGPDEGADLRAEVERLRADLEDFETEIEDRTVHRESIERELRRYVRRRQRRGHARGWGPYLVLLYGTAMTIGGFYYLSGAWAILAMVVIWLSTLGLYVFMVVVGAALALLGAPGRLRDRIERWRS